MKVERLVVGLFQTNCYVLSTETEALIIDPGSGIKKISEYVDSLNVKVVGILLTHGHLDHIGAVDSVVKKYHCPVYASEDDIKMMTNPEYNTLSGLSATIHSEITFIESDYLEIGDFKIEVLFTPGHTNGSVMYIIDGKLFSGDTLFKMSVGRTDLYSGSSGKLMQSLEVVRTLPDDMIIYPGHDQSTVVWFELENNPYL